MSDRLNREEFHWRVVQQIPLLVALVVLWMLLWGAFSWLNFATGIVVAVLVTRSFYLPPVELSGRLNPLRLLVFLGVFFVELVAASVEVAWLANRPGLRVRNAMIAVQLRTRSDFITTATGISLSLIPGSIVVEVDRANAVLYLHVFNVPDLESVERTKKKALEVERRLVLALGSKDDLERTAP